MIMQSLLVLLVVVCGCYVSSEGVLPRCADEVCARNPHCVFHRGRSVCWEVVDGADGGGKCKCCQNCVAGTNVFIDEECDSDIRSCHLTQCPLVKCTY
ncbi:unnamed protein product, partial [Ixodes hexagonus]